VGVPCALAKGDGKGLVVGGWLDGRFR